MPRRPNSASSPADSTSPAADPLAELSFEDAFARLEELVTQMESDDLPLERLLADNEAGNRLLQRCQSLLTAAEERLRQIELDPEAAPSHSAAPGSASPARCRTGAAPRFAADSGNSSPASGFPVPPAPGFPAPSPRAPRPLPDDADDDSRLF